MRIRDRILNTSRRPVQPWAHKKSKTQTNWFGQRTEMTGRGHQRYRQYRQRDNHRYQRETFPAEHYVDQRKFTL